MKMFHLVAVAALALSSCEAATRVFAPKPSEVVRKTAIAALEKDLAQGRRLIGSEPSWDLNFLSLASQRYCTEAAARARAEMIAYQLARSLLSNAERPAVERYAVTKYEFETEFETKDRIAGEASFCPGNQSALLSEYLSARRPIAYEAEQALAGLRASASQHSNNVTVDATAALAKHQAADAAQLAASCKEERARTVSPLDDPALKQGRDAMLALCDQSGN